MNTSTSSDASNPPTTEITMKSTTLIVSVRPNPTATPLASTASAAEVDTVSTAAASTF